MRVQIVKVPGLELVERAVVHEGCPDGIASAMLIAAALPKATVEFVQYGTRAHAELRCSPRMLFCDMSPPRERVAEFVQAGAIVLDHHEHARDVVAQFAERGVFGRNEDLESGAMLAHKEVFCSAVPGAASKTILRSHWRALEFATLAAIRDCWATEDVRWQMARLQAAVLMFYPVEHWLRKGRRLLLTNQERRVGRTLLERRRNEVERASSAMLTACNGRVAVFPDGRGLVSDVAELLRGRGSTAELACGFCYKVDGTKLTLVFSLRSLQEGVDVGAIAKEHGGGGHVRAAGFAVSVHDERRDPLSVLERRLGGRR